MVRGPVRVRSSVKQDCTRGTNVGRKRHREPRGSRCAGVLWSQTNTTPTSLEVSTRGPERTTRVPAPTERAPRDRPRRTHRGSSPSLPAPVEPRHRHLRRDREPKEFSCSYSLSTPSPSLIPFTFTMTRPSTTPRGSVPHFNRALSGTPSSFLSPLLLRPLEPPVGRP